MLPKPVKNQAARRASEMTTPRMLVHQLSQAILEKIPEECKQKGITVEMEEVYREGPFIVFQLRVLHVDAVVLSNDLTSESFASFVQWCVESMGEEWQESLEKDYCEWIVATTATSFDSSCRY